MIQWFCYAVMWWCSEALMQYCSDEVIRWCSDKNIQWLKHMQQEWIITQEQTLNNNDTHDVWFLPLISYTNIFCIERIKLLTPANAMYEDKDDYDSFWCCNAVLQSFFSPKRRHGLEADVLHQSWYCGNDVVRGVVLWFMLVVRSYSVPKHNMLLRCGKLSNADINRVIWNDYIRI